jgi:membrane-associated phospholipid phosphatase
MKYRLILLFGIVFCCLNVYSQYESQIDSAVVATNSFRRTTDHNWSGFIVNTGASVAVAYGLKAGLKAVVKEERPDHSDNKSFPSGHAAMAFAAARSIDKEFRRESIWIPIAGYAAAAAVGIERVASDRHHWYDVVAGAGVGFGAAKLTWWLSDKLLGSGSNVAIGTSGNTVDVAWRF